MKYSELEAPFWKLPDYMSEKLAGLKGWGLPSMYLEYQISKLHKKLKRVFPYYSVDGTRNVWISKPSYNARGVGIFCLNTLKEALKGGKKVQSRMLQKYIEKPLLLKLDDKPIKFDIR